MKNFLFWVLAFLITAGAAVYQRMTGPTYPVRGTIVIQNNGIDFQLDRSHETLQDYRIHIEAPNPQIKGSVEFKRFKSRDEWSHIPLRREGTVLTALLPYQPPAGKLAYRVILIMQDEEVSLTGEKPVVMRFKGAVPGWLLIPHVIIMFAAMLFSTRAGIEAFRPKKNPRVLVIWTTCLLFMGGMILGPLVQKYAFGALWTGFPFGTDLTDNKTLIAMIGWIIALIACRKEKPARGWVIAAAVLLLAVYLLPHSLLGSELDYSQLPPNSTEISAAPFIIKPFDPIHHAENIDFIPIYAYLNYS